MLWPEIVSEPAPERKTRGLDPFRPALPTPVAALLVLLAALVGLNTGVRGALASPLTQSFLIGFNAEASHFAFVTYQTSDVEQTGSAVLYVLELAGDRYVGGTPRGYGGMQLARRATSSATPKTGLPPCVRR